VAHGERGVDQRLVDAQRLAAEGRGAVEHEQGVRLAARLAEAVEGLRDARRALPVHDREDVAALADRVGEPLRRDGAAERALDADDVGARAHHRARQALAGHPGHAAHHAVARVHEVGDHGFRARAAGPGDRQRRAGARGERLAQELLRLVHDRGERGVQGAGGGPGEPRAHAVG
jgi:hypothetical protein